MPAAPAFHSRPAGDPGPLLAAGVDPLLARLYASRGIKHPQQLALSLQGLPRPDGLPGLAAAVELLAQAVVGAELVLVVGDFDADGATSTALAVLVLRAMGGRADYLVPDRFKLGYGLSPELVALALPRQPRLLLTVDNGISSVDGVAAANAAGVPVVVTDHHLPGDVLPAAAALVNPRLPGNSCAGEQLAGVGVAFYLLSALRQRLLADGWLGDHRPAPHMGSYLDLVALGTVADLVPLDQPNRILVQAGLRRMRAGRARPGIQALAAAAGRDLLQVQASDLGFGLAPRLNAAGRLTDMTTGIRCLLSEDAAEAQALAAELDSLNRERQQIEATMTAEAEHLLAELHLAADLPAGLCLVHPNWHQGVVGILASRVKEQVHRPVVAFAPGEEGVLKGSCRSVPGFHIRDALAAIDARHPGLVQRFGGHAMAAGLSLAAADFDQFAAAFAAEVVASLGDGDPATSLATDGVLPASAFTLAQALVLEQAGPWGQQFPEPLFHGEFEVLQARAVGTDAQHAKLVLQPLPDRTTPALAAIAFRCACPALGSTVQVAFRLVVNRFRGQQAAELLVTWMGSP